MNTDKKSDILSVFKLAILLSFLTCADTPNKPIPPKELFGWAGAPEDINNKPYDYFYAKFYGKVEILSTKLKAEDYQNKCIQSATKQANDEMFLVLTDASASGVSDGPENFNLEKIVKVIEKQSRTKRLNCKPISYSYFYIDFSVKGSEWRDCECVFYAKVPGGRDAIVARVGME